MNEKLAKNIDEYISWFPAEVQEILQKVRETIKAAANDAKEDIKYAMPTFVLNGNLVHFAAFKNHIGFYPAPTGTETFKEELLAYKTGKGSVQFPLDKPIPYALITKIVQFRVAENLKKAQTTQIKNK
ncbi:iron chaperone [Emticicia sp. 17c]|uniref:iron chaperone n=1 Tax=Emticicia sp. 17c TaxID=3127704 RepID=UPI00301C4500